MCGRAYSTYTDEELQFRYFSKRPKQLPALPDSSGLKPNFNMCPTHDTPAIITKDGERTLTMLRWGLVPHWADDLKVGYKMINARSETISEKPSFRSAFKTRRAIIPLSGFIEWRRLVEIGNGKPKEIKTPFCIHLKDEPIMSVAGIWESWRSEKGTEVRTFSIITTEANSFMAKIHDRMPVILSKEGEAIWLDPENDGSPSLQKLLKPCDSKMLSAFEISTLINSPKNNRPELLSPI